MLTVGEFIPSRGERSAMAARAAPRPRHPPWEGSHAHAHQVTKGLLQNSECRKGFHFAERASSTLIFRAHALLLIEMHPYN